MIKERSLGDKTFHLANSLILLVIMLMCIYPFYYVLIYSISSPLYVAKGVTFWPRGFDLTTYKRLLNDERIMGAFFISLSRAVIGTSVTVMCCSFFAYLVSKKKMFLRRVVYRTVVLSMYINAGLIPWYLTMKAYGLKDNYLLYILPTAIVPFYVIIIKTYLESLPSSLEEAAMIDGAGFLKVFFKIIFPISIPIVAAVAVFASVVQWNTWRDNFFLVNDVELQTMQLLLYNFLNEAQALAAAAKQTDTIADNIPKPSTKTIKMCITMVTVLPILCVYPVMQKHFVQGLMIGAIKG